MPQILSAPRVVILNASGGLLSGAKCYTYTTHTTTPLATYSDYALTTPNANPVVADGNGVFPIMFGASSSLYRLKFTTSADVLLYQEDDIGTDTATSLGAASLTAANVFTQTQKISNTEPRLILDESDSAADKRLWDIDVNGEVLSIRTRTDADGSGKAILTVTRGATTAISTIDIGNATDVPTITANSVALTPSTGTFTGTLTGCTTSPTATFNYCRVGNLVTIDCQFGLTATSNTTSCTVTGLPAALTPLRAQHLAIGNLTDNTVSFCNGTVQISGTTLSFLLSAVSGTKVVNSGTGFTNSGTKGVSSAMTFSYNIS